MCESGQIIIKMTFYLDSSSVFVPSHAINLIHDQDMFTAHCLRHTYKTHSNNKIKPHSIPITSEYTSREFFKNLTSVGKTKLDHNKYHQVF